MGKEGGHIGMCGVMGLERRYGGGINLRCGVRFLCISGGVGMQHNCGYTCGVVRPMCRAKCAKRVCVVCDGDIGWKMSSGRWWGRIRSVGAPNVVGVGKAAVKVYGRGVQRRDVSAMW